MVFVVAMSPDRRQRVQKEGGIKVQNEKPARAWRAERYARAQRLCKTGDEIQPAQAAARVRRG